MKDGVSLVIPVRNGERLVPDAHLRVRASVEPWGRPFELVFVDDGSTDGTWAAITQRCELDPQVRGVRLAHNVGQATAIAAGLRVARGTVVVTTDVDLETHPDDLVLAVALVDGGAAVASGRRRSRRRWQRELPAQLFNFYGRATGSRLRDIGCGTNAMSAAAAASYAALPDLRRELPTAVLMSLGFDPVEVDLRSRRPSSSQIGPRDLAGLWLAFEARRGPALPYPSQVLAGAALALGALRRGVPRTRAAAMGLVALIAPAMLAVAGRWTVPVERASVTEEVGGGLPAANAG